MDESQIGPIGFNRIKNLIIISSRCHSAIRILLITLFFFYFNYFYFSFLLNSINFISILDFYVWINKSPFLDMSIYYRFSFLLFRLIIYEFQKFKSLLLK